MSASFCNSIGALKCDREHISRKKRFRPSIKMCIGQHFYTPIKLHNEAFISYIKKHECIYYTLVSSFQFRMSFKKVYFRSGINRKFKIGRKPLNINNDKSRQDSLLNIN